MALAKALFLVFALCSRALIYFHTGPPVEGDTVYCIWNDTQVVVSGTLCRTNPVNGDQSKNSWGDVHNAAISDMRARLIHLDRKWTCGDLDNNTYFVAGTLGACMVSTNRKEMIPRLRWEVMPEGWELHQRFTMYPTPSPTAFVNQTGVVGNGAAARASPIPLLLLSVLLLYSSLAISSS